MVVFGKRTQTNMTLGRANAKDLLVFLKPIKKLIGNTTVLDTGTSGSTPVGYHDLPWPSAASGTPGLLEPASASLAGRNFCCCLCRPFRKLQVRISGSAKLQKAVWRYYGRSKAASTRSTSSRRFRGSSLSLREL